MVMSSLNLYLAELQACLDDLAPDVQQAVVEELQGHLEDRAMTLRAGGVNGGEEESMSEAIERFGEAREVGGALRDVHRRMPWAKVGLALLPGFFAIGAIWIPDGIGRVTAIGLVLGMVGFLFERRVAVWSFMALGMFFGLSSLLGLALGPLLLLAAIVSLVACRRRGIHAPDMVWILLGLMIAAGAVAAAVLAGNGSSFWSSLYLSLAPAGGILLPVAVGLLFARRNGVLTGLLVLAAGFVLVDWTIDPTYGLWQTPWGIVMNVILAGLLLVASPVWVLRSRSKRGRVWGLLLPAFIALTGVVAINAIVRTDPAILERIVNFRAMFPGDPFVYGISGGSLGKDNLMYLLIKDGLIAAQLFMGMALAAALYPWVESQWSGAGPDTDAIDKKLGDALMASA